MVSSGCWRSTGRSVSPRRGFRKENLPSPARRQLRDVWRNLPRLIFREEFSRRAATGLVLVVDIPGTKDGPMSPADREQRSYHR
jgi:hypothetical protein